MKLLLAEIQHNKLLWLLIFVPVVFAAEQLAHDAHTLLFALSVLAIVPLAALLSHATESVAAKTGDAVGGLLNATLGNLTELVIALTALRAGQFVLVKASVAGAIVTNTLFMLGRLAAARRTQVSRAGIQPHHRPHAGGPAVPGHGRPVGSVGGVSSRLGCGGGEFTQQLSVGLSVLLIVAYALSMLFSLKTHKELFASAEHGEAGESMFPMGLALATLAGVTVLVAMVSHIFVESVQKAAETLGMSPAFVGFIVVAIVGAAAEMASAFAAARKNRLDMSVGIALGSASQIALFVAPVLVLLSYVIAPVADEPAVLARRRGDDVHRRDERVARHQHVAIGEAGQGPVATTGASGRCRPRRQSPAAAKGRRAPGSGPGRRGSAGCSPTSARGS